MKLRRGTPIRLGLLLVASAWAVHAAAQGARTLRDLRHSLGVTAECGRCARCAHECLRSAVPATPRPGVTALFVAPIVANSKRDPRALVFFGVLWMALVTLWRTVANSDMAFWDIAIPLAVMGFALPFFSSSPPPASPWAAWTSARWIRPPG